MMPYDHGRGFGQIVPRFTWIQPAGHSARRTKSVWFAVARRDSSGQCEKNIAKRNSSATSKDCQAGAGPGCGASGS